MSGLEIRLLGTPVILVDGAPLAVDTRKAIALIACLALERGPHARDHLAALLWPESDDEHARSALRRTLSTLNRALGGRWLAVRRDTVALDPAPTSIIDIARFREALTAGDPAALARAVDLYRGDLLTGFALRDSPDFEDWLAPRAEALRHEFTTALERLVDLRCASGEFDAAEQLAARWLSADPLNEEAHRWRMRAAALAGDRSAALAHYRVCLRVLDAELGVAPLAGTTELYLAIRAGTLVGPAIATTPPAHLPPGASPVLPARPFVGREAELRTLRAVISSRSRSGATVVIEGEAGVGKTRLIDECARGVASPVLRARGYPGEASLAYGPIRELAEAAIRLAGPDTPPPAVLREVSHLVPALVGAGPGDPPTLDSPGAQVRLFAALGDLLAACAPPSGRTLVVVDDAQWLDTASAELLAYLVRRIEHYPVALVFALRAEDAQAGGAHLLEATREAAAVRVSLPRLSRASIDAWVAGALGTQAPVAAVDRLERESEGLPLLIAEYLEMIEGGPDQAAWDIPVGAREVLEARLRSLGDLDLQVLTAAGAIGRPFAFELVREASGRTEEEALAAVERLLARRFLRERENPHGLPEWEFTHEKLREIAYASMTATRRRIVHRRLAAALRRSAPAAQVAVHLERAGQEAEAAALYVTAGEEARALFANQEALAHYASALALGFPGVARVHAAVGDVLLLTGDFDGALGAYEAAAAFATDPDTARHVEHTLGRVYMRLGDFEQAEDRFAAATAAAGPLPPDSEALILADWSLLAYKRDDRLRAGELARRAVDRAREAASPVALARACIAAGIIARRDGDLPTARAELERALALTAGAGAPELRASSLNALALALADAGDLDRAVEMATEALSICDAQGDRQRAAAVHSNLADFHHARGRRDEALAHLEASAAVFGEIGIVGGAHRPEIWKLVDW